MRVPIGPAVAMAILLACGMMMEAAVKHFLDVLPPEQNGWRRASLHDIYPPDTLYRYINGGAELYLSYGFQDLLSTRYEKEGQQPIKVDIMDMGRSADAFGVFVHSCEIPATDIGQGSEYAAGLLTFWKDRYYVSILAYPVNEEKEKTVLELGRLIAASIPANGPPPPLLDLLPEKNRIDGSIRFFHHYIWLNSHLFVAAEDILDMRNDVDAALAAYGGQNRKYYLLVIAYPDAQRAAGAEQWLIHALKKASGGSMPTLPNNGPSAGFKRNGRLLAVVLNAPDPLAQADLLAATLLTGRER